MKHLKIVCDEKVMFDGDVDEWSFTESDAGVKIEGRLKRAGAGGQSILDLIAAASKQRSEEKKQELAAATVADADPAEG